MSFFSSIWNGLIDGLEAILRLYEGFLEPLMGDYAWGVSIILLTVTVRIFLIPLMVRQTKSMRAMQQIQPELKRIKEKYKADRAMMKTDPERYKKLKEKEREAQMGLYQEHSVNPVGGCLPLVLQMPIFLALFNVLRDDRVEELATAPFLGIDSLSSTAAAGAGIGAVVLVLLQVVTTFYTQKQMQARNTTSSSEQAQAQKLMMYIMPVFLGYLSFTFPIGVVLYWVTTNFWTMGQQAFIFRQVEKEEARIVEERKSGKKSGAVEEAPQKTDAPAQKNSRTNGRPTGSKPSGNKPTGNKPTGSKPGGSTARNGKPSTSKPSGSTSRNSTSRNGKPSVNKPSVNKPSGAKPSDKPSSKTPGTTPSGQ
jgi:YidC/Oxa1 family membrane protein insertase